MANYNTFHIAVIGNPMLFKMKLENIRHGKHRGLTFNFNTKTFTDEPTGVRYRYYLITDRLDTNRGVRYDSVEVWSLPKNPNIILDTIIYMR